MNESHQSVQKAGKSTVWFQAKWKIISSSFEEVKEVHTNTLGKPKQMARQIEAKRSESALDDGRDFWIKSAMELNSERVKS